MNNANEALGSQVAQAATAAARRPGAASIIEQERQGLRNQLGALERAREGGGMTPAQIDLAQHNLLAVALARFHAIERAPENNLHNLLDPQLPAPELSPQQRASVMLERLRAAGCSIKAHRDGALSIEPASKLPMGMGDQLAGLREHVAAALCSDVLVIPASVA